MVKVERSFPAPESLAEEAKRQMEEEDMISRM